MTTVTSLEGVATGRYVVTTYNGTRHFVDLDARTSVRLGAPGRAWGDKAIVAHRNAALPGTTPKVPVSVIPTTPDGTEFHFTSISGAAVGQSMLLENAESWRRTSEIRTIDQWDGELPTTSSATDRAR